MKITNISVQARNPNRVNVSVDGKYRFSLDIAQLVDSGLKKNQEIDEEKLRELEEDSSFGKLYTRTLEYCLMRPHSSREVKDYLWKKTRASKYKTRQGEIRDREGASQSLTERVYEKLQEKGYIDDEKFAKFWVESRNQTKGSSPRKLSNELRVKGVANSIIDQTLSESERNDDDEIIKIINKKRRKYPDNQKLMQYLARQGFSYDDIKSAITAEVSD